MLSYKIWSRAYFTSLQHLQDAPWSFALSSFFRTVSIYGCTGWFSVELSLTMSDFSLDMADAFVKFSCAYLVEGVVDWVRFGFFLDNTCPLFLLSTWGGIMFWSWLSCSGVDLEWLSCARLGRFGMGIKSGWFSVCIELDCTCCSGSVCVCTCTG